MMISIFLLLYIDLLRSDLQIHYCLFKSESFSFFSLTQGRTSLNPIRHYKATSQKGRRVRCSRGIVDHMDIRESRT
jgi:hypothetical protein